MCCFARAGSATTSTPATHAEPAVGMTRVVSMPMVVVLPAPFGPSRPKISPRPTSRSSDSTAGRCPLAAPCPDAPCPAAPGPAGATPGGRPPKGPNPPNDGGPAYTLRSPSVRMTASAIGLLLSRCDYHRRRLIQPSDQPIRSSIRSTIGSFNVGDRSTRSGGFGPRAPIGHARSIRLERAQVRHQLTNLLVGE